MHTVDTDEFAKLMHGLVLVFALPKGIETVDVLITPYWNALLDLPIETVRRELARHTRYGKFFPKPAELRPKDSKPRAQVSEVDRSKHERALAWNSSTWNHLLAGEHPERVRWQMLDAYHCRTHSTAFVPGSAECNERITHAARMLAKLKPGSGYWREELLAQEIRLHQPTDEMAF